MKLYQGRIVKQSPKEKIINKILCEYNAVFVKEATHKLLTNPNTGCNLFYDFYIPSKNVIIEYDGKDYHDSEDVLFRDEIKNNFARKHNIKLIRLNHTHNLYEVLGNLMSELEISKKDKTKKHKKQFIKPNTNSALKGKDIINNISTKERYKLSKEKQQNIQPKEEVKFNPSKSQKYKIKYKTKRNKSLL
jgi:hypothetical protein